MSTAAWWILAGAVVAVSWLGLVILGMAARLRDRQVPTIPAQRRAADDLAAAKAKVSGYRG